MQLLPLLANLPLLVLSSNKISDREHFVLQTSAFGARNIKIDSNGNLAVAGNGEAAFKFYFLNGHLHDARGHGEWHAFINSESQITFSPSHAADNFGISPSGLLKHPPIGDTNYHVYGKDRTIYTKAGEFNNEPTVFDLVVVAQLNSSPE
ncbi:hypothetical protein NEOLI_003316 [Neolecta irregularis DAH-3]|uniref:Uncharacterized protein n=1 Tax=Neolecta irregularis (strain DAH-3) TaxID=1198029 RepID=A0A1U7LQ37_NEOID|nr:hypothetical protein NEOLI_003316 [Neolecta irregularis DAH-3]|eukprot:OLL24775.1 hypothetical protein NEOLI_003316 [Neolecta irregularis DAH-3]